MFTSANSWISVTLLTLWPRAMTTKLWGTLKLLRWPYQGNLRINHVSSRLQVFCKDICSRALNHIWFDYHPIFVSASCNIFQWPKHNRFQQSSKKKRWHWLEDTGFTTLHHAIIPLVSAHMAPHLTIWYKPFMVDHNIAHDIYHVPWVQ